MESRNIARMGIISWKRTLRSMFKLNITPKMTKLP